MPALVRRVLIFAAVDGLVLQPAPPRNHKPATEQAIKIAYKSNAISPLLKDRRQEDTAPTTLEAYGVVGLLSIAKSSWLISISSRRQVAQIRGKPIYVITDIALIPLSSQAEAEKGIAQARNTIRRRSRGDSSETDTESESSGEEDNQTLTDTESVSTAPAEESEEDVGEGPKRRLSVAQDVIRNKGLYGRFADRWFSKRGWSTEGRRMQGMSSEDDLTGQNKPSLDTQTAKKEGIAAVDQATPPLGEAPKSRTTDINQDPNTLLPKLLRTTRIFFASQSFFFSYEYDLSHSLAQQSEQSSLPLFKQFDPLFFWNKNILQPFVQAGQHGFVLPLIQGFVGQRAFSVQALGPSAGHRHSIAEAVSNPQDVIETQDEVQSSEVKAASGGQQQTKDFLLTLVSRRSVKRAGLRYLRRGVDDEGHVANAVETEQILSPQSWDAEAMVYSMLQCRGSIPLFFSQTPYSFKPWPITYGSTDSNNAAFRLHFANLRARYGGVQVASLVDKHGSEASIGEAFQKHAEDLNKHGGIDGKGTPLDFEWFDFHAVCRGMKFENVSQLFDTLSPTLSSYGWSTIQHNQVQQTQSGILRTNCMDCLDRTNVVQSACGRDALEKQLQAEGISINLTTDPTTSWFNTLWADNGDAISRQYAGTAALKGDYTRTRHRNVTGALTDFSLTLSRYYNNIVNDFFAQIVIDYLLGNASEAVFSDFEADMKSSDYAVDLRKVRQTAIDTCVKIVIEDPSEDLQAGWTLSCPSRPNTRRALPFEECVLLITNAALYFCRFDWATEKVRSFERVPVAAVRVIDKGAYITSTLAKRHLDPDTNIGFVIEYVDGEVRVMNRAIENQGDEKEQEHQDRRVSAATVGLQALPPETKSPDRETADTKAADAKAGKEKENEVKILAFKALPPRSSIVNVEGQDTPEQPVSEKEMVSLICDEVQRVVNRGRKEVPAGPDNDYGQNVEDSDKKIEVQERDVISLADAKKSTGYLEQLGYSLKKLVWS